MAEQVRQGGGRAHGGSTRTWWSRRFLAALESFGMADGLAAGRRSARAGHVLSLSLSTSLVVALVRDDGPEPHRVRIAVRAFDEADWARVEAALAGQARFAARLLAGDLPPDIEAVFARLGLALFPVSTRELSMDCSCTDWHMPCRHLAAACHLLAESFDTDPFGLLAWRGRDRDRLLERLRVLRGRDAAGDDPADGVTPLADLLDSFWAAGPPLGPAPARDTAGRPDAILDQLDPLGLTLRRHDVVDLLRPAYRALAKPEDS